MPGAARAPSFVRRHLFTRSRTRRVVFTPLLNSSSVGRAAAPGTAQCSVSLSPSSAYTPTNPFPSADGMSIHFGDFDGSRANGDSVRSVTRSPLNSTVSPRMAIRELKDDGRCGMVLDEGVLFRTNEDAFVKTKRKLTDDCDLWCVVSLPGGVFSAAGAGVKTNLLFFTKGKPTERVWYYDLSDVKVGKKTPLTLKHFEDFAAKLPGREASERSWTVDLSARKAKAAADARPFRETARAKTEQADVAKDRLAALKKARPRDEAAVAAAEAEVAALAREARDATAKAEAIEAAVYDLKAVNPNRKATTDTRTPAELLDLIEAKGRDIAAALAVLRGRATHPA